MRTLLRPTGFVDSPFGHDGKLARLADGLGWFASVELIHGDGTRELVGRISVRMRSFLAVIASAAKQSTRSNG